MNQTHRVPLNQPPRRKRRRIASAIAGTALTAVIVAALGVQVAATPDDLNSSRGTIGDGQTVASLNVLDQFSGDDDWDRYIEFIPAANRSHVSRFRLSPTGTGTDSLAVAVNFRGPDADENRWTLSIRNFATRRWVEVFDNAAVDGWEWGTHSAEVDNPTQYVDGNGKVRLRFRSSNDNDVAQLDFVGVELLGGASPPSTAPPTTNPPTTNPSTTNPPTTTPPTTTPPTTTPPTTTPPTTTPPTTTPPTTTPPTTAPPVNGIVLPPSNTGFDYQIGEDYPVPANTGSVSRDWFGGTAASGLYNVCYVNAFQTQEDSSDVDRPDEFSNWPADLVLSGAQDPNWTGEFMVNIDTQARRDAALAHLEPMIETCASKGFDAVEYDNLDSWTRFDNLPFNRSDNVAFATMLTELAHDLDLAVAQKNTTELITGGEYLSIGFDFAIAEECGRYDECGDYVTGYGDKVFVIEYNDERPNSRAAFNKDCATFGSQLSIVIRDRNVVAPSTAGYFRDAC